MKYNYYKYSKYEVITDNQTNFNGYNVLDMVKHQDTHTLIFDKSSRLTDYVNKLIAFRYFFNEKLYDTKYIEELIFNFEYYNIITLELIIICYVIIEDSIYKQLLQIYHFHFSTFIDKNIHKNHQNLHNINININSQNYILMDSVSKILKNKKSINLIYSLKSIKISKDYHKLDIEYLDNRYSKIPIIDDKYDLYQLYSFIKCDNLMRYEYRYE